MLCRLLCLLLLALLSCLPVSGKPELTGDQPPPGAVWLDSLDLSQVTQSWGQPQAGESVEGNPLSLAGTVYRHGLGTHADSSFSIDLGGGAARFEALVGVDDEMKSRGSVCFEVWVDERQVYRSPVLRGGDQPVPVSVDLAGARWLELVVTNADDGIACDHADWAGAVIYLQPGGAHPTAAMVPAEPPPPIASGHSPIPAIHGPRVVGATPGRPFLFLVPATGEGPLAYSASNLEARRKRAILT